MRSRNHGLVAMALLMAAGSGALGMLPGTPYRTAAAPRRVRVCNEPTDALRAEIAAHNADVERRKAEKRAAKLARRSSSERGAA